MARLVACGVAEGIDVGDVASDQLAGFGWPWAPLASLGCPVI